MLRYYEMRLHGVSNGPYQGNVFVYRGEKRDQLPSSARRGYSMRLASGLYHRIGARDSRPPVGNLRGQREFHRQLRAGGMTGSDPQWHARWCAGDWNLPSIPS